MNTIKSHFEMHTRFRNGIFLFSVLIFLLILIFYFYPYEKGDESNLKELTLFQTQVDSLKKRAKFQKKLYEAAPFNPNFITDYKGYTLGMSSVELNKLHQYRADGKWINSVADFKKVTGISDSLLIIISPRFKFPDWIQGTKDSKSYAKNKYPVKSYAQKEDLNTITISKLQEEIGVPDFIANRIINYKNKIGGFIDDLQLKDVSGLYDKQRIKILAGYTVKTNKQIKKININRATVKELMEVPYFDFETALEIRDFIKTNGEISDFLELKKIEGFSLEKIDRIELYLVLN